MKIEIFQYKKRMPHEDRVRMQHSSVYVESMTRMRNLFNSTISSTLSEFFSPLALSLITELSLFLSHFVTFWFQLRRFITHIFERDERRQAVVDPRGWSLVRYVTTEIPLTAFHPGFRSLKKSRENTIAFHSSAVGSNRWSRGSVERRSNHCGERISNWNGLPTSLSFVYNQLLLL